MKILPFILGMLLANSALAATEKLIILSPHRKSIQQEFVPKFKAWYKTTYKNDVEVEWLDQGGTSDNIRFVRAKFKRNPKTSGIDVFWGGGSTTFTELDYDKMLAPYSLPQKLSKEVPSRVSGVPLFNNEKTWYATAMSSFGIFYNKKLLKITKIDAPKNWSDLAKKDYNNRISLTDPRRSGSAATMNLIVLQSQGWEKGWSLLNSISGNVKKYQHSSSAPIKAVVAGDATVAMAIDFYAKAKIGDLGADNLGFSIAANETVLNSDPVGILKGAPNKKVAERFVEFLLNKDTQKLLILPKGAQNGPKLSTLGRIAVNKKTYQETEGKRTDEFNPFNSPTFMVLDLKKASKMQRVLNDLFGSTIIDVHRELKSAWKVVLKNGSRPADVAAFGKMPVTEKQVLELADKWDDNVFRTKKINEWNSFAKTKFNKIASK